MILAAGGTGGHLFPAFALGEELGRRKIDVDLMTDTRGDRYGSDFPARNIYQIPSATLSKRSIGGALKTTSQLASGTLRAYRLIARIKPNAIVGFGGYPSFCSMHHPPPDSAIDLALWSWSLSSACGNGTRMAGRPSTPSSATVEAPARPIIR